MNHERHHKEEGGGVTVTCSCGRLWWDRNEAAAVAYWRKHLPKEKT